MRNVTTTFFILVTLYCSQRNTLVISDPYSDLNYIDEDTTIVIDRSCLYPKEDTIEVWGPDGRIDKPSRKIERGKFLFTPNFTLDDFIL